MKPATNPLLKRFVGRPAILDSNLLLLRWCAEFDPTLVQRFKRLNSFRASDLQLLVTTLQLFSAVRTTPHVLTEVSNLATSLPRHLKDQWFHHYAGKVQTIQEDWTPSSRIAEGPWMWLGLTDAALATLATSHVILTIDFPLSNSLESRGLNVINFNHLRDISAA